MQVSGKFYDMQGIIFDFAPDGIIVVNEEGEIDIANPKAYEIFGYKQGELEGKPVEELVPSSDREKHKSHHTNFFNEKKSRTMGFGLQLHGIRKDKSIFPVDISLSHYDFNRKTYVICLVKDISERKQFEKELAVSDKKYKELFNNMTEGIFQTTIDGKFITVNPALVKMLNYEDEKDMLESISDISKQLYAFPHVRKEVIKTIQKGKDVKGLETQFIRKDKSLIWVSLNIHAVRDDEWNILYFEGTNIDIDPKKRIELELAEKEKKLSLIFDNIGEIVYYVSLTMDDNFYAGEVQFLNSAVKKVTGYDMMEFYQNPGLWFSLIHPDDLEELKKLTEEIYKTKSPGIRRYRLKLKDKNNYAVFEDRVVPQVDDNGNLIGIFGVAREVKYTLHL